MCDTIDGVDFGLDIIYMTLAECLDGNALGPVSPMSDPGYNIIGLPSTNPTKQLLRLSPE